MVISADVLYRLNLDAIDEGQLFKLRTLAENS
jgi:hypothetical protein